MKNYELNPKLDLVLERVVDVPLELVWKAWTDPEELIKWFVPRPWTTAACEIDLRPGGQFRTVMRDPDGNDYDNVGCYLEIVENEKLVWTSALGPGYRPVTTGKNPPGLLFTGMLLLESVDGGTKYTAIAIHGDEAAKTTHDEMGFQEGWGTVLDQLVAAIQAGEIR